MKWIGKFESISVRMAKEQSLPISAEGLGGACGLLRCCLRFEHEQYRQVKKLMKETVSVPYDDDRVLELPLADIVRNQPSHN